MFSVNQRDVHSFWNQFYQSLSILFFILKVINLANIDQETEKAALSKNPERENLEWNNLECNTQEGDKIQKGIKSRIV